MHPLIYFTRTRALSKFGLQRVKYSTNNSIGHSVAPVLEKETEFLIKNVFDQCGNRQKPLEIPIGCGDDEIFSNDMQKVLCPHDYNCTIAYVYYANRCQIEMAIKCALTAQRTWSRVPATDRIEIWRKAADIIENDAIYFIVHICLTLGKTIADSYNDVKRLISALRSNAVYLKHLSQLRFEIQGDAGVFPTFNLRPLDGFVAAVAPFTSATISADLALTPALMGNTVLWNPTLQVAPITYLIYTAFRRAGLPSGVLNLVPANGRLFLDTVTDALHFAGLNYNGSAQEFQYIFKRVGEKMKRYICFPRLVAECPGKNFHFVHSSAVVQDVCKASIDAAFNFAGQYPNSLSRLYVPASMWLELKKLLVVAVMRLPVGDPTNAENFMGPVIDRKTFNRLRDLIMRAKENGKVEIVCGGVCYDTKGYFVNPTIVAVSDPLDPLLSEPIHGPILPIYVYADDSLTEVLKLVAHQSKYSLSGSIFARKDEIVSYCINHLRMSASNLYINERCTGNPQGITPFGGNRLSGSNDKTGSAYFLMRWSSPLLTEETVTVSNAMKK